MMRRGGGWGALNDRPVQGLGKRRLVEASLFSVCNLTSQKKGIEERIFEEKEMKKGDQDISARIHKEKTHQKDRFARTTENLISREGTGA